MNKNISESRKAASLVKAKPHMCWENAAKMMHKDGCEESIYVEGVVITSNGSLPVEHAWVVRDGEIIDPTQPDLELRYFPALEWPYSKFVIANCKYNSKPFFQHRDFKIGAEQVEMDKARALAEKFKR